MSDTPTPLTDAAAKDDFMVNHDADPPEIYVSVEFARKLERELIEARIFCDDTGRLEVALIRGMSATPSSLTNWKTDMRRQFAWLRENQP